MDGSVPGRATDSGDAGGNHKDNTLEKQAANENKNGDFRGAIRFGAASSVNLSSSWRRSPERATYLRIIVITLGVTLLPLIIAGALLTKYQIGTSAAINQADRKEATQRSNFLQASSQAGRFRRAIDSLEFQIANPAKNISQKTPGQLQTELNAARQELAAAQAQTSVSFTTLRSLQAASIAAHDRQDGQTGRWILYAGIAGAVALGDMLIIFYVRTSKYRDFENRVIVQEIAESKSKLPVNTGANNLSELWLANEEQLDGYHRLVLNYAASTRLTTQLALCAGFLFLVTISVLALLSHSLPSAVASSVVATAGAVVTGFVARAVLRNSEASSKEVVAFFSHPIETQRILTAQQLMTTMSDEAQQQAKLLMIGSLIRAKNVNKSR